jgi:hypothetical protein
MKTGKTFGHFKFVPKYLNIVDSEIKPSTILKGKLVVFP